MGLVDWWKSMLADKEGTTPLSDGSVDGDVPPEIANAASAERAGLNFRLAIDAHQKWKVRLENYIAGRSSEELKVDVVGCDDQCTLGKWIYGRGGERFGFSETFYYMKAYHAQFHRCAGDILATAQTGDKESALRELRGGNYARASEHVRTLLASMFVIASDGRDWLDSHLLWKARLQAHINGEGKELLDELAVARDDQCPLGQWLAGIGGERYGDSPMFPALLAAHERFHRCAGEVLAVARLGDKLRALKMLDEGAYPEASAQVAEAIVALFERTPEGR